MSKYFETISELQSALDLAFPGCEIRSINNARLGGFRTMLWVSWVDGARRSQVAAVVEPFRTRLAALHADLVVLREFSAFARATIAGGARSLPGDFWARPVVQDFDLRPIVDLQNWLDRRNREVRIAAHVRALASV